MSGGRVRWEGGKSDEGLSAGYIVLLLKVGFCNGWLDCVLAGWIVSAVLTDWIVSYSCIAVSLYIAGAGLYRLYLFG